MSLASATPVKVRPSPVSINGVAGDTKHFSSDDHHDQTLATLSPSRAASFKQCPRLFQYRSIDRIPEATSQAQARGTTAHLALERLFNLPGNERTAERLFDLFREVWTGLRNGPDYEDLFETVEEERAWGIKSLEVVANYLALEDPASISPLGNEIPMSDDLGPVIIRGILDRMDERDDGRLVITDYKTGKAPSHRYALPAFYALKVYALLVRRRWGRTPAELRLLYLGNSTVYSIPVDDRMLDGVERQLLALAERIRQAIKQNYFPPRPSFICNWCSFQEICPAYPVPEDSKARPPSGNGAQAG